MILGDVRSGNHSNAVLLDTGVPICSIRRVEFVTGSYEVVHMQVYALDVPVSDPVDIRVVIHDILQEFSEVHVRRIDLRGSRG